MFSLLEKRLMTLKKRHTQTQNYNLINPAYKLTTYFIIIKVFYLTFGVDSFTITMHMAQGVLIAN